MREAVVVASSRTPLAKVVSRFVQSDPARRSGRPLHPDVARESAAARPGRDRGRDLSAAAIPKGTQGMNVARIAAIRAGLPVTVAGTTVNRFCSSGLQAVAMAAHEIIHEGADAAIGGGVESITAMASAMPSEPNPWVAGAQARHLHGHGRHGRGRGQALQDQPRGAGRILRSPASSAPPAAQRRASSTKSCADAGDARHPRQEDRRGRRPGRARC